VKEDPPAPLDLLVVGDVNPDLIVVDEDPQPVFGDVEKLVDRAELDVGGSSAICACGAARLGLRTALVGIVGDDLFGRHMLEQLSLRGVDVSSCIVEPSQATGLSIVMAREVDRAILTFAGAIGKLRVEHVPRALLTSARHLHVGGYFLLEDARADLPALFEEARGAGATTSLDCNWDPSERWGADVTTLLEVTDVFFCNVGEALRISGRENARSAGDALARRAGVAVVKQGRRGALAVHDGAVVEVLAPAVEPVDTIGAGDSFDAGFLSQWIAGRPLEDCLRVAVACGALSTRGRGGTASQPTLDEAGAVAGGLTADG
jgi:sugar/nucleoside kinase (ribokinase family)